MTMTTPSRDAISRYEIVQEIAHRPGSTLNPAELADAIDAACALLDQIKAAREASADHRASLGLELVARTIPAAVWQALYAWDLAKSSPRRSAAQILRWASPEPPAKPRRVR